MKYLSKIAIIISALLVLHSCTDVSYNNNPATLGKLGEFEKEFVKGGDFWLTTYQKITDKNRPYVFYIEGDGAAFNGKYKVSRNPTPRRQMFIKLAAMDERPNVVYIGRPCQYTPMSMNPKCNNQYWTNRRLSEEVVESINQVINKINNKHKFSLVGFSGGGGVAVLIAAKNKQVKDIVTIAANLDLAAFVDYHNVSPMIGSLNPIDYTSEVSNIPQLHISGGKDNIVPPFIADKFVQKANSNCVKQKIFPEITHRSGWQPVWNYVTNQQITCY